MCDRDKKPQFQLILFGLLLAAFSLAFTTRHALAADKEQPAAKEQPVSANATPPGFPDRITTLDGKTYEKTTLERVDPDGLLVAFAPVERGLGSAKLKFRNLAAELRERYGYDPARASDYETAQARGEAVWMAGNAVWTEQRRAAQAEVATWERQLREKVESRLAAAAEQARVDAAHKIEKTAYYYPVWSWPGTYNGTARHSREVSQRHHMPQEMHEAGSMASPVPQTMGPMRPLGK